MFQNCSSLTNVVIPEGIEHVEMEAFDGCESLTSVTIPVSVTSLGESVFSHCSALTDIYYNGSESDWNGILNNAEYDLKDSTVIHYNN